MTKYNFTYEPHKYKGKRFNEKTFNKKYPEVDRAYKLGYAAGWHDANDEWLKDEK